MTLREGLAWTYGMLVEGETPERVADVDAILRGETPPSEILPEPSDDGDWRLHIALTGGEIG